MARTGSAAPALYGLRRGVAFDYFRPPAAPAADRSGGKRYDAYVDRLCALVEHVDHGSRIDTDLSDLDLDTLRSEAIA